MRTKNSLNNIIYNLVFLLLNSILAFTSKSIMISYIGSEYTGLTSICRSILGILSIADLGISSAVTYSLYKPIKNKNYEKINEIINMYKYIYKVIGVVILLISIILTLNTDLFIHSQNISSIEIKIYFFIFCYLPVFSSIKNFSVFYHLRN